MGSDKLLQLTDENFKTEVLESEEPVLVDFWAEWCMPCKMLAPTIEELAEEYAGRLKVAQVDTDSARDVSLEHNITAIPTLILFKGGKAVKKLVGMQQKADLKVAVDELLG